LLGGVSVSCRGDPLSSLDAEYLRFFAGALSSSCSPEGLPSRSDLSCPHTSDGEQLGAVVAVASAQNCGASGVGGGSEMPAHGLGSLQRCFKQFHSAPIIELASVPEFGLHSLIRSHSRSIRTFGAHVFRVVAPEKRPVSSRMPKRLSGDKIRVRVQTCPQFPTIVCDAFYGQPAADHSVKRQELRAQLPSERESRWSGAEINTKVSESADALRAEYKHFDVKSFLSSVNDPSLTWVRRTTSAGNEKMVLRGDPRPIDVYYLSDMSPRNEDGCGRSLGDPA